MAVIHELSPHVANLIAAGEVVERPASVAKELLENAIDARASRITVEIENGGISYLRIADNGYGIAPEDAPIAFRRHATSKLKDEGDLSAISTLGFRGEALAAIASVSRIDLLTKQRGMLAGTHLHLEASQITKNEEAGCPEGTTIIIRDIFFNTPARMKFLKKDFTEAGYVLGTVQHAALSHPEIAFTLIRDGKQVFSTAGDGKLMTPIFGVLGKDLSQVMIEVDPFARENICVMGYITKPHAARPNRGTQHFFVNGRYVKNRTMQAALEEAYRNKIITGKYPSCVLFLELPLGLVDVNVHPAKTEIKFAFEKSVFEAVYIACKNTIEKHDNIPLISGKHITVKEDSLTDNQQEIAISPPSAHQKSTLAAYPQKKMPPLVTYDERDSVPSGVLRQEVDDIFQGADKTRYTATLCTKQKTNSSPQDSTLAFGEMADMVTREVVAQAQRAASDSKHDLPIAQSAPHARVLGEAFHTYIVAEDTAGIIFIDKHAAHERMIFNELRTTTVIPQQQLLTPMIVELSAAEAATLNSHFPEISAAGFDISSFGEGSFAVRCSPAYLDSADIPAVLSEMADKLSSGRDATADRLDDLIHMVSCKAAIKGGWHTSLMELQEICDRVLADSQISCCPHGRPVTVRMTKYELDKLFKRVNQ